MGRSPKHFSVEEKRAANHQSVMKYRQSPRGQTMLSTQRATLRRRKGPKAPPPPPRSLGIQLPPLSERIEALQRVPLPEDHKLFREALLKPQSLDLSDIERWKAEPPFEEDDDTCDPYSAAYCNYTHALGLVLHGTRLREQNERDAQRRAEFEGGGTEDVMNKLREEIGALLDALERVSSSAGYHPFHASREHAMQEHWLQWQARSIYHLYHLNFL
ncbi:hypothetical protein B0H14DRAFT_3433954 [Mycena olivaceomarginata]|nr:hypothetical protein B0H14DRAFT_2632784 [Mycena olivaceomarginata]KAJ7788183.1 hypothetical protein B0H14DRAFT_3504495 [Mycena olivaceomarginata]KAJ7881600.1 hypothetical protein B0H14DRAFT_3433954 [Mycena olivaceomarginata]